MDCANLFRIVDGRDSLLGMALLGFSVLNLAGLEAQAQPVAIGPDDVSRLRQLTDFHSDWSGSDSYNLDHPIELLVTIEGLLLPEEGDAELLFSTLSDTAGDILPVHVEGNVYHATLQLATEAKRLGISHRRLKAGMKAYLKGWPATALNRSPNVLLIDEIDVVNGKRFVLHDYQRMRDRKAAREKDQAGNPPGTE